jgi:hypothetical protein
MRMVRDLDDARAWPMAVGRGHDGWMIPLDLAVRLRDAGLAWEPAAGDWFVAPDRDMDDDVFVLGDMTIRVYEVPEGSLIGFNGTTEWALDDLDKDEAVWLPREDQLRELLGERFLALSREPGGYLVRSAGGEFRGPGADQAYGEALLHLLADPDGAARDGAARDAAARDAAARDAAARDAAGGETGDGTAPGMPVS